MYICETRFSFVVRLCFSRGNFVCLFVQDNAKFEAMIKRSLLFLTRWMMNSLVESERSAFDLVLMFD